MTSRLLPGYGLFVDDAGSLDFNVLLREATIRPLIYCATLLPLANRDALLQVIPKSSDDSQYIKSSDKEMTEAKATEFVRRLFQLDVYCGFVYILASDQNTLEIARDAETATNARRRGENKRLLRAPTVLYYLCVGDAVAQVAGAYGLCHSRWLNYADLLLDSMSLPKPMYKEMKANLAKNFQERMELQLRSIE